MVGAVPFHWVASHQADSGEEGRSSCCQRTGLQVRQGHGIKHLFMGRLSCRLFVSLGPLSACCKHAFVPPGSCISQWYLSACGPPT